MDDSVIYKQITVKMNGKGVILRQEIIGSKIKTKSQFLASKGNFIMSKIDARNGAFGIVPAELNGAIVTQDFPLFKVNSEVMLPQFLNIVIQSPQFIKICQTTSVGTSNRRRLKVDKFLKSRIPLPNIEEQSKFLERINAINQN
ncbi:MAG: restriction endonuclease subunit S [Bacteroidetes bacterium]|nr:restriction endonuclease subunit S [Bacteroidota bacterium]